jgi:hypothetical protein
MESREKKTHISSEVENGLNIYGSFENNTVADTYM